MAWVPVGKVPANVYSRFSRAMSLASDGPSTAPFEASAFDMPETLEDVRVELAQAMLVVEDLRARLEKYQSLRLMRVEIDRKLEDVLHTVEDIRLLMKENL